MTHREFLRPTRSIEFLFSHSLPRILNADREKKGKERGDPEGTRGEILFLFPEVTLSLKGTPTNPPINNRVIDKLKTFPEGTPMSMIVI